MEKILVIGHGVSGRAALRLAKTLSFNAIAVSDAEFDGKNPNQWFDGVDLVVVSPGVGAASPLLQEAVRRKLRIESELQFGADHFAGRIFAVTGTNGKTTTVELTTHLLQKLGVPARYAGNIGVPLSELAAADRLAGQANDAAAVAVVEVSSFQLEYTPRLRAEAAVILNVESDHLDRYPGGMAEYRRIKERIFTGVPPADRLYGMSMPEARNNAAHFTITNDILYGAGQPILALPETALNAPHNRENLLAALELTMRALNRMPDPAALTDAIRSFHPGDHRLAEVAVIHGVRYINDSKATNPAAVLAALRALEPIPQGNILLLAGGLDKDMDFTALAEGVPWLKMAALFGACRKAIMAALEGKVPTVECASLAEALQQAQGQARPNDIVLLSPAAASMDMFKDYKGRGETFARLVRESALR